MGVTFAGVGASKQFQAFCAYKKEFMFRKNNYTILANEPLTSEVWRMVLAGDTQYIVRPGQFVAVALEGRFLRRPISVCDCDQATLTLVYKVVGDGTAQMAGLKSGAVLDLLTGLGNGFDTAACGPRPLLAGGGVGVPPLYMLCASLIAQGRRPVVLLGFNTAAEVFYDDEFRSLGAEVHLATVDGSAGSKGLVTDLLPGLAYDYVYACGPLPMLRALSDATGGVAGQLSFEERMGCGFGACMGCTCQTAAGPRRICKEGPVLRKEEIIW